MARYRASSYVTAGYWLLLPVAGHGHDGDEVGKGSLPRTCMCPCALCLHTASVELLQLDHELVALGWGSIGIRLLNARIIDNGRAVVGVQRSNDVLHLCCKSVCEVRSWVLQRSLPSTLEVAFSW
jgi:hypothetical protein